MYLIYYVHLVAIKNALINSLQGEWWGTLWKGKSMTSFGEELQHFSCRNWECQIWPPSGVSRSVYCSFFYRRFGRTFTLVDCTRNATITLPIRAASYPRRTHTRARASHWHRGGSVKYPHRSWGKKKPTEVSQGNRRSVNAAKTAEVLGLIFFSAGIARLFVALLSPSKDSVGGGGAYGAARNALKNSRLRTRHAYSPFSLSADIPRDAFTEIKEWFAVLCCIRMYLIRSLYCISAVLR